MPSYTKISSKSTSRMDEYMSKKQERYKKVRPKMVLPNVEAQTLY